MHLGIVIVIYSYTIFVASIFYQSHSQLDQTEANDVGMQSFEPSAIELPPNSRIFGNPDKKTKQLVLQVDPAHLASWMQYLHTHPKLQPT